MPRRHPTALGAYNEKLGLEATAAANVLYLGLWYIATSTTPSPVGSQLVRIPSNGDPAQLIFETEDGFSMGRVAAAGTAVYFSYPIAPPGPGLAAVGRCGCTAH
jgi:hypothetical protein